MAKLLVIVGSTRPTRAADRVVPWVLAQAQAQEGFDVELADLREWPLPIFGEHPGTLGDITDPTYSDPLVRAWNKKVKESDAFLIVTPEYNHSVPAVLKNAIDSVWLSFGFRNKPVATVGYSAGIGGGIRSIEHLAQMFVETEAVPLRNATVLPFVNDAFDDQGQPVNPMTSAALKIMLDDLTWWTAALDKARAGGELVPGQLRARAALMALRKP
ncbi:NAD(P)H-dependent oxidoreductase [Winogradskya consettensis]|uniref:FMN reductase n=1 Tax=Winogradskya consettensis TaxID=113560 RepID=A0A919S920_9ACTN|nr:NAD(P)H-dependent oxidoreductase [Actinoplanes consettensis]GIM67143.1 FMN reductase [Actinoplanes consettensis]